MGTVQLCLCYCFDYSPEENLVLVCSLNLSHLVCACCILSSHHALFWRAWFPLLDDLPIDTQGLLLGVPKAVSSPSQTRPHLPSSPHRPSAAVPNHLNSFVLNLLQLTDAFIIFGVSQNLMQNLDVAWLKGIVIFLNLQAMLLLIPPRMLLAFFLTGHSGLLCHSLSDMAPRISSAELLPYQSVPILHCWYPFFIPKGRTYLIPYCIS